MLEEPRVFPGQDRVNEIRRDFVERDLHPIRAGESAVDFAVDVEYGVALRHVADLFQVIGLRPDRVEKEDGENEHDGQPEKRELPGNADASPALFSSGRAHEEVHR